MTPDSQIMRVEVQTLGGGSFRLDFNPDGREHGWGTRADATRAMRAVEGLVPAVRAVRAVPALRASRRRALDLPASARLDVYTGAPTSAAVWFVQVTRDRA